MSSNSNKIDALNVDESKLDEYVIRVKDFCITNGEKLTIDLKLPLFLSNMVFIMFKNRDF